MPNARVVLYGRLSKATDDAESASVSQQLQTMRAVADRHGLRVVAELADDGISASAYTKRTRPAWTEVLRMVHAGEVEAVGFWELSRATRRLAVYADLRDACEQANVVWLTPSGLVDPADDGQRLGTGVQLLVAEQHSRDTSKRTKRALAARADAGQVHGRQVYGLRRIYDAAGKLAGVEVEPHEAAVLRDAAHRVLAGASLYRVCKDLNQSHEPAPSAAVSARVGRPVAPVAWGTRTMKDLLVSPALAGLREHRGRLIPATWTGVWDPDYRLRLVALLTAPSRGTLRNSEVAHQLSGILFCGKCEAALRHHSRTDAYQCCGCRGTSIDRAKVEIFLYGATLRTAARKGDLFGSDNGPRVEANLGERAQAQSQLEELSRDWLASGGSVTMLARLEAELTERLERLDAERAALTRPQVLPSAFEVYDKWTGWSPAERRHMIRAAVGRVTVGPATRSRWTPIAERLTYPDLVR